MIATSHGFAPILAEDTTLLVLGSMPGQASLQAQAYYAHPRNGFWPIVAAHLRAQHGVLLADDFASRYAQLLGAGIGLWDVLAAAIRPGSLDAKIQKDGLVFNNFQSVFAEYSHISQIALNGQAAHRWFMRQVWPTLSVDQQQRLHCHALPSTSPAHAACSLSEKMQHWLPVLARARPECQLESAGISV